jgi:peptidoglycan/xylan/chitin deacetylase (PgdA/CDA1 family)/lysozyme family protein
MALTFDAGSDSSNAKAILDILRANNIKSTFFLTGQNAEKYPDIARLIYGEGHEIGNHSYSHPYFTQINGDAIISQIRKCETAIKAATGQYPIKLFRPPYGSYNSAVLDAVGAAGYPSTVMWTIDTIDWAGTSADAMVKKVISNAQPGAIVLMHVGGGTNTPQALPLMIAGLKDLGYSFIRLSQIISLPQQPSRPVLRRGSSGSDVVYLQQSLFSLGYNSKPIDGKFGPITETAVKAFQRDNKIAVDGVVGPITWMTLEKKLGPSPTHKTLRRGSTGSEVKELQEILIKLGYAPGPIDGRFGPSTEKAVKAFQANNNLVVDGIVGPKTWAAIDKLL